MERRRVGGAGGGATRLRLGGLLRAHRHPRGGVDRARGPGLSTPSRHWASSPPKTSRVVCSRIWPSCPTTTRSKLAKRLGTLDVLSGGRVIVGVGVGSLQPEFEVLRHAFDDRGERSTTPSGPPCRWARRVPEYHGTHYEFEGFIVEPSGLPRKVEVWVGGRTQRSLRRALQLGDAWMPFGFKLDELTDLLTGAKVRDALDRRSGNKGGPLRQSLRPRAAHRPPRRARPDGRVSCFLRRHRRDGVQRALRPPLARATTASRWPPCSPSSRAPASEAPRPAVVRRARRPAGPQLRLYHLAGRVAGQLVDEMNWRGTL